MTVKTTPNHSAMTTISLAETQAIADLAKLLYSFLPATFSSYTWADVAKENSVEYLWQGGSKLPAIYHNRDFLDVGGLMSYGPNLADSFKRAATYVDKILKGAKPANLPVEQPTKFEFIINLKTAKQIGLAIPPSVLARADKVIK